MKQNSPFLPTRFDCSLPLLLQTINIHVHTIRTENGVSHMAYGTYYLKQVADIHRDRYYSTYVELACKTFKKAAAAALIWLQRKKYKIPRRTGN